MTIIKLKTLEWDRCFSFGDSNIIKLDKEPVTQIIAPNGHGKSSIPLIMEETLYNKNSKGVPKTDIPNRELNSGYKIKLSMDIGEDSYDISIDRKSSIKVILTKNGEDISSHTAPNTFKDIADIIGLDFKTFQQLVYQSTNSSLEFLTATDTSRKKFLIDLFDLSEYTRLFEVFKAEVSKVSVTVNTLESKLGTIRDWINKNSNKDLEEKEPIVFDLKVPDYSDEIVQLKTDKSKIEATNKLVKSNLLAKTKFNSLSQIDTSLVSMEATSYDAEQRQLGDLESKVSSAKAVIKKLEALDSQCPTCLQSVDQDFYSNLLVENKTIVQTGTDDISRLTETINKIKNTNNLIARAKQAEAEYNKLKSSIDFDMPDEEQEVSHIDSKLKELQESIRTAEQEITRLSKLNLDIMAHNSKVAVYKKQSVEYQDELDKVSVSLNTQKDILKNLEVLKKAFSTNGLIAYKLENLVKDLEYYTNEYLAELADGRFTIEFSINNDKLNVIVTDDGHEIGIKSLSSGEMARVNISTLLAIRKLMSSIAKNTINVLFLDEVISVLDDPGREKLVEVLNEEHSLNTFLVSHSWSHPLVDKVTISKTNGISKID